MGRRRHRDRQAPTTRIKTEGWRPGLAADSFAVVPEEHCVPATAAAGRRARWERAMRGYQARERPDTVRGVVFARHVHVQCPDAGPFHYDAPATAGELASPSGE